MVKTEKVNSHWLKSMRVVAILFIGMLIFLVCGYPAWAGYTYTELLPPGWRNAVPISSFDRFGINDLGVVVGAGNDGTHQKGFIYSEGI